MNIENPLFFFAVIIGPIFIIAGIILYKFPPKKINYLYGYRTKNSRKNENNWNYSQKYSAKIMLTLSIVYSLTLLLLANYKVNETLGLIIGLSLMFLMCFGIFYFTERKLKKL